MGGMGETTGRGPEDGAEGGVGFATEDERLAHEREESQEFADRAIRDPRMVRLITEAEVARGRRPVTRITRDEFGKRVRALGRDGSRD